MPTPQFSISQFTAVNAVSSTDVWAIGTSGNVPFTEHWNGKAWSVVPLKDPTAINNNVLFTGVKAISPTNVYAVGAYQGYQDPVQFIEHWNGRSWSVVANPFNSVIPSGIDASSANDIWIVGQQRYGSFTEHFNGTAWSVVPTPAGSPDKVTVVSPTNAWAVGTFDISHWNGSSWKVVSVNARPNELTAVTNLSATDVWAVGFSTSPSNGIITPTAPLAEHFNGTSWSVVNTPTLTAPADGILFGMSSPGGHVYAVGSTNPNTINPSTNSYEPGTALIVEDDHG
ncbi:MAG: hypothetical protein M3137_01470 [Actinomycetota bacterium]|nr:hypothetical protein [Actinomycetota bacterium]